MIGHLLVTKPEPNIVRHEYYCDRCPAPEGAITLQRVPAGKPKKCASCNHKLGAMRPPVDQRSFTKVTPEGEAMLNSILAQVQIRAAD